MKCFLLLRDKIQKYLQDAQHPVWIGFSVIRFFTVLSLAHPLLGWGCWSLTTLVLTYLVLASPSPEGPHILMSIKLWCQNSSTSILETKKFKINFGRKYWVLRISIHFWEEPKLLQSIWGVYNKYLQTIWVLDSNYLLKGETHSCHVYA